MQAEPVVDRIQVALTVESCWHRVPGGTARAVIGLAAALQRRHDVEACGLAARHSGPPDEPFVLPATLRVVHSHLPRRVLYEYWHRSRRSSLPRSIGIRPDVIHAAGGVVPPARNTPLVVTLHDLAFLHRPEHFTKNGVFFLKRALELAKNEAAAVICPSRATASDCRDAGIDEERIHVVPLGVSAPIHDRDSAQPILRRLGIRGRYVLWVGTIEPRKNLPRLLEAFAQGAPPDVTLVLAGPDGWKEELAPSLAGTSDRVVATGFVTDAELSALYAGAELFCFPSLLEGFGFPVLEAMAHGVAVVTSAGTSTEEIVGEAGRLVDPHNTTDIAEQFHDLLADGDGEAARLLGAAGRERAEDFSWDNYGQRVVSIYGAVRR